MRTIDRQELKNILELHLKWVFGETDGKRADLSSADLSSADLSYADLSYANLRYANLSYADLSSADLSYANLRSANLSSANLSSADLKDIIEDFYSVLEKAKTEVVMLYDSLISGKIDGSQYQGECACLVGTIANVRNEKYDKLSIDLRPDSKRLSEKWFLGIQRGDTPDNNSVSALTAEWMRTWMEKNGVVVPQYRLTSSLEKPEMFTGVTE